MRRSKRSMNGSTVREASALAVTCAALILGVTGTSALAAHQPWRAAEPDRQAGRFEHDGRAKGHKSFLTIALPVHTLSTDSAPDRKVGMFANRYPRTIAVRVPREFANRIEAYGTGFRVWIGPRGWTGSSGVGVDGSTTVSLFPATGHKILGARLTYHDAGACAGCAVDGAAPYFPAAMREGTELFSAGPIPVPQGLKLVRLSATLVTYQLPREDGLIVRGVVFYQAGSDPVLKDAKFVMPAGDAGLLSFLLRAFISREKLR